MREPTAEADRLAKAVWESALEVHRTLGAGFLELAYERALEVELLERGIPFERQKLIDLRYKGVPIGEARLDLLVGGLVVVELKAVESLHPIHHAQVLNYLRATNLELGLLINFNVCLLKDGFKRIVLT
jgi:GxxExxY protein